MANISLDLRPNITAGKIRRLKKVAADMEIGMEISVILERTDAHQSEKIMEILRKNNFKYQTKGGHANEFYINARKGKAKE